MKTCRNCNQELTDDILFCPKCGTKIEETEPKQETPPEMKQGEEKPLDETLPGKKPARSQAFWFGVFGGGFAAFLILCFLLLQWKPTWAMGALQHGGMVLGGLCIAHWLMGRKKKENRVASIVVGVLFFLLSSAAKEFQPEIMEYVRVFSLAAEKKASTLMPLCDDPAEVVIQNINKNLQMMGSQSHIVNVESTDREEFRVVDRIYMSLDFKTMLDRTGCTTYTVWWYESKEKREFGKRALIDSNGRIIRMELPSGHEEKKAVLLALHCSEKDIANSRSLIEETIVLHGRDEKIGQFSSVGYIMSVDRSREIVSDNGYLWAFSPDTWNLRTKDKKGCSFDFMAEVKTMVKLNSLYEGMTAEEARDYFSKNLNWIGMEGNGKEKLEHKGITYFKDEYRKKGSLDDVVREDIRFFVNTATGKILNLQLLFRTPDFDIAKRIAYAFINEGKMPSKKQLGMYTHVDADGMMFVVSVRIK